MKASVLQPIPVVTLSGGQEEGQRNSMRTLSLALARPLPQAREVKYCENRIVFQNEEQQLGGDGQVNNLRIRRFFDQLARSGWRGIGS
ncbi:hypothetical protein LF1_29860 [Rubripirellula obstinata]|uniref:Uncharacterized protein n=1 Tax=Rubripirellula obstinata TaxID=406547 RepID=A0A5B1CIM3_9BACT|nr:hypothetical protein LF1_29860 [Rubripirellula obstinata]